MQVCKGTDSLFCKPQFITATEVQLPVTIKAKLLRSVLVKKERDLFKCWPPKKMGDSCYKARLNISEQEEDFIRRERESRAERSREGLKSSLCADQHSSF